MSSTNHTHVLSLNDLSVMVRLGCEVLERAQPQEVRLTVEFRWQDPPKGEMSDNLSDTVCYAEVSHALFHLCEGREFKLIEHLAVEALRVVRIAAGEGLSIGVCVHKVKPPVLQLVGGAKYYCGDFRL